MSRTDAHAPHWVTATWYKPVHNLYCRDDPGRRPWWPTRNDQVCDLPGRVVRHRPRLSVRHNRTPCPGETRCTWEPDWAGVSPYGRPDRGFVEHIWHNPERTRLRGELARARAEYRGSGGTDVDPEPRQARHCAAWMYW